MDVARLRDATRCPGCGTVLSGRPEACPSCMLPLRGPLVDQLWYASQAAADALDHRAQLLRALRETTPAGTPTPHRTAPTPGPHPGRERPPFASPSPLGAKPHEGVTPRTIQQSLLVLGVVLLGVAAIIFTAVAWGRVGLGGRTAILAALTVSAGVGTRFAHRRELPGTSEALGSLAVGLLLLDAYGVRENDLAGTGGSAADAYWAVVFAMVGVLALAAHRAVPVGVLLAAAAAGVQLPLPVLADRIGSVGGTAALLVQGTTVLVALRWVRPVPARLLLLLGGALAAGGSAVHAAVLAYEVAPGRTGPDAAVSAGLLGLAAACALTLAWFHRGTVAGPEIGTAVATAALLGAAHAPMHRDWTHDSAVAGGTALLFGATLLLIARPRLPRQWRDGPLTVVALGGTAALLDVADPATRALTGPFRWLGDPWSQPLDSDARTLLGTTWPHHGTVAVTLGLLTATAVLVGLRLRTSRAGEIAGVAAGGLATVTAVVLPVAIEAPYLLAVLGLVSTGCALLIWAALSERHHLVAVCLTTAGAVAAGLGLTWSLASQNATPIALLGLLVAAGAARAFGARDLRGLVATAVGALAVIAEVGVLTRIAEQSRAQSGTAAVLAAGALAVSAGLIGRELERRVLELTSLGGATIAFGTVGDDALWSSNALLAAGCAAALVALRRDRHRVGWLAGALLTLSSWVRLAEAAVEQPEAYTAGPAVALLAVGWFARRRDRELSSWRAYGAGLTAGLVPSLAATLGTEGFTRPLLLGGVALGVLLAGVGSRLQAPLVLGGAVLGLDALVQISPYAASVPRWVSIGGAGLLLLGLGATFERRLRDLRRLEARLSNLG